MYENLKLNRNLKEINSNLNIKLVKYLNTNKLLKKFDDIEASTKITTLESNNSILINR